MNQLTLNIADRIPRTEAEGPGVRYALWLQGCPLRCPGCCNPHMLEFREAARLSVHRLADEIAATDGIEGITLLGGEPFSQPRPLGELARRTRQLGLSVMVFSGHTLHQLRQREDAQLLLSETDLLVDGPYLREQAVLDRRWIGSANQQVHFLSDRYAQLADDRQGWDPGPNTIELRISDGRLRINGFPHPELSALVESLAQAPTIGRAARAPAEDDAPQ